MAVRAAFWIFVLATVVFAIPVMGFSVNTLAPALSLPDMPGCHPGPEARFWGYGEEFFAHCIARLGTAVTDAYSSVLLGVDRALAASLGAALIVGALRLGVWSGAAGGLLYTLSDIAEGMYLVAALDGDLAAVATASVLTITKFIGLFGAIAICLRAAIHHRSPR